jgi:hypothetical protein
VIGQLDRLAAVVVLAAGLGREHGGEQVGGAHAEDRRRGAAAAGVAQHGQRAGGVPAPAGLPHRRLQRGHDEGLVDRVLVQELEDRGEREGVLGAEREQDRVVGGGGLQLEVEAAAELLAQAVAEGPVDARAEGGVDHQLHAAGLVEEALGDQAVLGRDPAERLAALADVRERLGDAVRAQAAAIREQCVGGRVGARSQQCPQFAAQAGDLGGELGAAGQALAVPERDVGRLAARVLDADAALLDPADPPRVRAELEDVAGHAVDREVLVDGADDLLAAVLDDGVVGLVRDRAAGGEGRDPGAAAAAGAVLDAVEVQQRAGAATAGGGAVAEHGEDLLEGGALEPGEGRSTAGQGPQGLDVVVLGGAGGDQLLGEDVERAVALDGAVDAAGLHRPDRGGALDQVVAGHGDQAALRGPADVVTGAADPLAQHRDRARRADLDDELDLADVDAELERGGGDDGPERAGLQPGLDALAGALAERAVVGRDHALAEALLEVVGDPLGEAPARHEDQGGLVVPEVVLDLCIDVGPGGARGDRGEGLLRDLDADVERLIAAGVDEMARAGRAVGVVTDEEAGGLGGRLDGRR